MVEGFVGDRAVFSVIAGFNIAIVKIWAKRVKMTKILASLADTVLEKLKLLYIVERYKEIIFK